jgi:large subunit ribosomal protein L18e
MRKIEKERVQRIADIKIDAKSKNAERIRKFIEVATKPRRQRVAVDLSKINKLAKNNENIAVPGKVLGNGNISKQFSIAAVEFSKSSLEKLKNSKCSIVEIKDMLSKEDVRLIM